ncbi:MAG: glycosyltransferase family 9 protein [Candidatus Omnitrophota bacterium]|jgi:heptosyltransferase-2
MNKNGIVNTNCLHYKGSVPCFPHKQYGYVCAKCKLYKPFEKRILIIKLGAAGDVIRTTPLLRKLRQDHPNAEIIWLTYFPEFLSSMWVDKAIRFELKDIIWLKTQKFDWLINLDKDDEAIALSSEIMAKKKSGFIMDERGKCKPVGNKAETYKWLTGLWDGLNKKNTKNYIEEIFEICGYKFKGEKYIIEKTVNQEWDNINKTKIVVGLNTGCGGRWVTRLWGDRNWINLAKRLKKMNYEVILLGGKQEHGRNRLIAKEAGVKYFGHFTLPEFVDLIDQCEYVVSQVTMAMHIAIGLNKTLILLNNIFNKNEFFLYNNGAIIEPKLDCLGCFKQIQDKRCVVENCMHLVKPDDIIRKINELAK